MHAVCNTHLTARENAPLLSAAQGLRQEMALLDDISSGRALSGVRIWRCEQAIVVPRRLMHKPNFERACARMDAKGWPVIVRETGGDLTPQAPGLINVTLAFRQRRAPGAIHDSYQRLCQPLISCLKALGIDAYCASVDGAFCNGDYNLVVGGRKLAGTAQRWRKMAAGTDADEFAVLAHAVILCQENLSTLWQMGNAFYRSCDMPAFIDPALHVSLAELMPEVGSPGRLHAPGDSLMDLCLQQISEAMQGALTSPPSTRSIAST